MDDKAAEMIKGKTPVEAEKIYHKLLESLVPNLQVLERKGITPESLKNTPNSKTCRKTKENTWSSFTKRTGRPYRMWRPDGLVQATGRGRMRQPAPREGSDDHGNEHRNVQYRHGCFDTAIDIHVLEAPHRVRSCWHLSGFVPMGDEFRKIVDEFVAWCM
ncbi:hypothetical protein GQ600_11677 [Phytophthora cactorum]|nr:hypothetical protein GQ600_11677 [Phytophthora cactorum]